MIRSRLIHGAYFGRHLDKVECLGSMWWTEMATHEPSALPAIGPRPHEPSPGLVAHMQDAGSRVLVKSDN